VGKSTLVRVAAKHGGRSVIVADVVSLRRHHMWEEPAGSLLT
jgi:dephospho-CoA kinase